MKKLRLRDDWAILLSIVVFTGVSCWIWQRTTYRDIGSNLVAGGVQLLFTFFIFNYLISRRDDLRERPRRISAFQDVSRWFNSVIEFYASTLKSRKMPVTEFLTRGTFVKAGHGLDLSSRAPVLLERDWWQWMAERANTIADTWIGILQREGSVLPPDIYRSIHVFCSGSFLGIQRHLLKIKNMTGADPQRHDWFFWQGGGPTDEELGALREIQEWALKFYKQNVKSDPQLFKPWEDTVGH